MLDFIYSIAHDVIVESISSVIVLVASSFLMSKNDKSFVDNQSDSSNE